MHQLQSSVQQCGSVAESDDTYFYPSRYAIGYIQRAIVHHQQIEVSSGTAGKLYVFPDLGIYISALTNTSEFFTLPARELLQVRVLAPDEAEILSSSFGLGRPIDELLWNATHVASKGRLLEGCEPDDVICLKHWPNLTRIPCCPNTIRLASFFSRVPTSLQVAHHLLGIPLSEIYMFYSAAKIAGLVETPNRHSRSGLEELQPHKDRSLLEKIVSRISVL